MRLSFSSRIPRTMMLRRSFARLVRIPPIPDLTGANLHQAWGQKPAWNTDQDPRPRMLWWELPGFDFVDWQKSMDRSFSRNTNTTEPDAPALSPAVRVRTGLINKGWSARTMFWFVVGLFSVFYFAHAIQERSRNEARDEMVRPVVLLSPRLPTQLHPRPVGTQLPVLQTWLRSSSIRSCKTRFWTTTTRSTRHASRFCVTTPSSTTRRSPRTPSGNDITSCSPQRLTGTPDSESRRLSCPLPATIRPHSTRHHQRRHEHEASAVFDFVISGAKKEETVVAAPDRPSQFEHQDSPTSTQR